MTDAEFLSWIKDRIVFVYGESPNVDFVLRLGELVEREKAKDAVFKALAERALTNRSSTPTA